MKFGGILIALAIVLSGCSGEPTPKEPQKTTSPTPKSTATPPVMPAQAKEDSPEGAAAFVNYWVKVSNYAAATGDVQELGGLSNPGCTGCSKYIDLYRDTYEAGGYFKGGDWSLGELKLQDRGDETFLSTKLSAAQSRYRETRESEEFKDPAQGTTISFAVKFAQNWEVTQLGLGEPQ